ncbi:CDP-glycerol glycerophosphotransferase family protein [Chitinilyticum litopenaei]|uniref:CDP-glycerol glycerophosphotransferase family protein n=1 Tax=Chitinilyticum litopenaei TaxID=1121276 RepID=UPI00040B6B4F|nr:CDP-glycerol glycerophosphotransferase family protein [Chitinilyticum litopenaei]
MPKTIDRIGFLLHLPEIFNHYSSVWTHMPAGSVEAVISASTRPDVEEIVSACERLKVPWQFAHEKLQQQQRYDILVSTLPHQLGIANSKFPPGMLGTINLRFMYANGKAGWNFQDWNRHYDAILCFGPYQAEKLEFCEQTHKVQMGYPRFDRYFNEKVDKAERLRALGCDPAKPTVVWLPTWKELCSIDHFADEIAKLQGNYNVIVKPHPITVSSEPLRMAKLASIKHCLTHTFNNVELFQLADFILADYGGSSFGAIYTDRNLLLLDLPNGQSDSLTGSDSPEQLLRQLMPTVSHHRPQAIAELLGNAALWHSQAEVRAGLRQYFFAPHFGYASQVAALAISNAGHLARRGAPSW